MIEQFYLKWDPNMYNHPGQSGPESDEVLGILVEE